MADPRHDNAKFEESFESPQLRISAPSPIRFRKTGCSPRHASRSSN